LNEEISYRVNSSVACRNRIGFWRSRTLLQETATALAVQRVLNRYAGQAVEVRAPKMPLWHPHVELTAPLGDAEARVAAKLAVELTVRPVVAQRLINKL